MKLQYFIIVSAVFLSSCGDQNLITTDSPMEKIQVSVAVDDLFVTPNSIFRPDLPTSGTKKKLNYTITGKLSSSQNVSLSATITINQVSSKSSFSKTFAVNPVSGSADLNLTSFFDLDDNVFYGSESSLSISDGSSVIFSKSPLFSFSNDAVISVTLDSVVYNPAVSVKIGQSFSIRAYVSYAGNVNDLKSVSYTGKRPDGSNLTPAEMLQTANKKVYEIVVPVVQAGTATGKYVRVFKAADRYGNLSNTVTTEHSVVN